MKLDSSFGDILTQIEKERGIPVDDLRVAIEVAFLSAYKKKFGIKENIQISIDNKMTDIIISSKKIVVSDDLFSTDTDIPFNPKTEIALSEAIEIDPEIKEGEEIFVPIEVNNQDFGRMAAQVAKQVITQKLRDAEKKQVYDEYIDKKGQIVTGLVQRLEKNNVIIKLGKHEAVLMPAEQIPGEKFRVGDRLKMYLTESSLPNNKGSQLLLSRANPHFVEKLFEIEVPELLDGTVAIKSISREPGYRTKIAVYTIKSNLDPVGTCIGSRGSRIKAVLNELVNEKIDIIKWSENPQEFIANALSPSKVNAVKLIDRDRAHVIVPDDQLSLAIGKEGQNVRLAAKLTNFHIDIESESQAKAKVSR
ncbi:MAG: transcription termination factor NusA [Candidatus Sericytochromatia bacterium]